MYQTHKLNKNGFSLPELFLVLFILSITLTFTIYALVRRGAEQNEPEHLKQIFIEGSNSALYKQRCYRIVNDTTNNKLILFSCDSDTLNCTNQISSLQVQKGNKVRFSDMSSFPITNISFGTDGATYSKQPYNVTYATKKGLQKRFKVIAAIGQLVEVQ